MGEIEVGLEEGFFGTEGMNQAWSMGWMWEGITKQEWGGVGSMAYSGAVARAARDKVGPQFLLWDPI